MYFWSWHCFVCLWVLQLWPKFFHSILWKLKWWKHRNNKVPSRRHGLKRKWTPLCHPASQSPSTPTCPLNSSLLLNVLLHALLFYKPSQDTGTDGPVAACCPSGSCWHGKPLALCPYHHPQSLQEPKSVLAPRLNAEVQGPIWLLSCTVTVWHHWQQRESKIPHICHQTRFTTKSNQRTIVG